MKFSHLLQKIESHNGSTISFRETEDGEITSKSFKELASDVRKLVYRFKQLAISPGSVVGIQAANSYAWVAIDLAAIECGIVLEVFHENMPFLDKLEDSGYLTALITDKSIPGTLDMKLMPREDNNDEFSISAERFKVANQDTISRVYSSGTTGTPKGIEISRRGVEYLVSKIVDAYKISNTDSHIIYLPLSNFQQRMSIYGCLFTGASFLLSNVNLCIRDIRKYGPSIIICPPILYETFLKIFIPSGMENGGRQLILSGLGDNIRVMITGMAPSKMSTLEKYREYQLPLFEVYGTTEAGMIALNIPGENKIGSVGKAIDGQCIKIDSDGEVKISIPFPLSNSYFENKKNMDISDNPNLLPTGDIGYIKEEYLYLKGRKNDVIVTSGGVKFNPYEIENKLSAYPFIENCMVFLNASEEVSVIIFADSIDTSDGKNKVNESVAQVNSSLQSYEKIIRIYATNLKLEKNKEFLTANLKLNRSAIKEHFINNYRNEAKVELTENKTYMLLQDQ